METIKSNLIIHCSDGNAYEIEDNVQRIEQMMYEDFIKPKSFIKLIFSEGGFLYVRKDSIIAFYENE